MTRREWAYERAHIGRVLCLDLLVIAMFLFGWHRAWWATPILTSIYFLIDRWVK